MRKAIFPCFVANYIPQPTSVEEQKEEQIKYWWSRLPEDASLSRLVMLAHARWVIEQFYARNQTGMRLRPLSRTQQEWTPSTSGFGHAGLQFPDVLALDTASVGGRGFSPSVTRSSLPGMHRQARLWLLQIQQIQTFRPRRTEQSITRGLQKPTCLER